MALTNYLGKKSDGSIYIHNINPTYCLPTLLDHYWQNDTRRTAAAHILLLYSYFGCYLMHVFDVADYLFWKKKVMVASIYMI